MGCGMQLNRLLGEGPNTDAGTLVGHVRSGGADLSGGVRPRPTAVARVLLILVLGMTLAGCRPQPQPPDPSPTWQLQWQAPGESPGEWANIHSPQTDPPRFRLAEPPGGGMAWRAEIAPGTPEPVYNQQEKPIAGGQRAEGVGPSETEASGTVRYEWRTMFDPSFPSYDNNDIWQVFAQWHQGDPPVAIGNSPPIAFTVDSGQLYVQLHSAPTSSGGTSTYVGDYLIGSVDVGKWHDFATEVRWSTESTVGTVAVWHNGKRVQLAGSDTYIGQTMFPGATGCPDTSIAPDVDCTYMKMGFYRKAAAKPEPFIVWHDDVRRFVQE